VATAVLPAAAAIISAVCSDWRSFKQFFQTGRHCKSRRRATKELDTGDTAEIVLA
jgi:hypothetical protein